MDSFFGDNNGDEGLDFGHIDDDNYSTNWMSEIFETVGDPLLNDHLMTDVISDHANIKLEDSFSPKNSHDSNKFDFPNSNILIKSEGTGLDISSPSSPSSPINCSIPSLSSTHSNYSGDQQHRPSTFNISNNSLSSSSISQSSSSQLDTSANVTTLSAPRSVLRNNGAITSVGASQRVQYVVRHNPTVYVQSSSSNGGSTFRHVPRLKRQDVYKKTERFDNHPDSGYLLYPDTPPGSNNSSDSEQGCSGSVESSGPGDNGDLSPTYSVTCYSSVGHRSNGLSSGSSLAGSFSSHHQPVFQNPIPQSGVLILTEEEKRTLISEGYPIPTRLPLTKQEERNLKKIRRKIKNKISAQESRRKKKEYLETLEKKVEAFSQENNELKRRVDNLENTNRSLLSQLRHLQQLAGKAGSSAAGTCLMVMVLCFAVFLAGGPQMSELDGLSATSLPLRPTAAFSQVGYAALRTSRPLTNRRSGRLRRYVPPSANPLDRYLDRAAAVLDSGNKFMGKEEPAMKEEVPLVASKSRLLGSAEELCLPQTPKQWWWFDSTASNQATHSDDFYQDVVVVFSVNDTIATGA